ncbi:hypothetical protein ACGF5M_03820 [Gemmatimonadota bacterium]
MDVLRDAPEAGSRLAWTLRASRAALHVGVTHWSTPRFLRPALSVVSVTAAAAAERDARVHVVRLEGFPGAWEEVEESLGRTLPLPWLNRTAAADDWQEVYDDETRAMIGSLYAADVEAFDYAEP